MVRILGQHQLTITDVEVVGTEATSPPTVAFEQSAVSLAETDTVGTEVKVQLSAVHPSGGTVVVPISIDGSSTDTATRGVDYELRQGPSLTSTPLSAPTIAIPAGQTEASFWISPLTQSATQAPEVTLTLTLATSVVESGTTFTLQGATLGSITTLTGSLATVNPSPVVRFTSAVSGFDEPATATARTVDVELASPAPSGGSSVAYTLTPTTSALGVWTQTSSSPLTWAAGESGIKQITFTHNAFPGTYKGDEALDIQLSSPSGCQLGSLTNHDVAWREADADPSATTPTVGWLQTSATVTEGQPDLVAGVVVTNSATVASTITVNWQVKSTSTAQSGTHYSITGSSPATIGVGQTAATFEVAFPDNALDEPNTTLILEITSVTGGGTLDSSADEFTITIQDDDLPTVGYDPDGVESTGNLDWQGNALAPKRVQVDESAWVVEVHPNGLVYPDGSYALTSDPVSAALAVASTQWDTANPTLSKATVTQGSENDLVLIRCSNFVLDALGNETSTLDRIQQPSTSSRRIHPFTADVRLAWSTAQADVGYPVVRDIVFFARPANSLVSMDAWFVQTDGLTAAGSDTTPMLFDNVRFERINFVVDASFSEQNRCFHMPGFTMPNDPSGVLEQNQHGTIKFYDCRFSAASTTARPQMNVWCEARANFDFRHKSGLAWNTFGAGSNTEHYHGAYFYSVQALAGKGNYFIGLTNDVEKPPLRTLVQIVNRREAVPGRGTNGEIVFLNVTGTGVGGGNPGGSFLSVWGNNGRTYFRNCTHDQGGVSRVSGGLFVGHDYAYAAIDHPRGVYPIELETDRWYTSEEVVVHGFDLNATNVDGRYPMQFIGVETVRLIDFDLRGIGNSAAQLSLNNQQNSNGNVTEGPFPGLCFTKQLVVSGLLDPDTGAAYGGALSAYPGWATGITKGSDGYHQNWWQDLGNKADFTTDAHVDAWVDIVGEQYTNRLASSGDGLGTITDGDWPGSASTPTLPTVTLSQIGPTYFPEPTTANTTFDLVADWGAESMLDLHLNYELTGGTLTEGTHFSLSPASTEVIEGRDPASSVYAAIVWTDGATPSRRYRQPITLTLLASAPAYTTGTKTTTIQLQDGGTVPQVENPRGSGTLVNTPVGSPASDTISVVPQVDMPTVTFLGAGLATIDASTTSHTVTVRRQAVADGSTSGGNADGLKLTGAITVIHAASAGTPTYNITTPTLTWAADAVDVTLTLNNIQATAGDEITLRLFETGANPSNLQDVPGNITTYTLTVEGTGTTGDNRYQPNAVADYRFEDGTGSTVSDSVGSNNLTATGTYAWGSDTNGGFLELTGETTIQNGNPFADLNGVLGSGGVNDGNGYTVECWLDPAGAAVDGPARIVGIPDPSDGTLTRNMMLGQDGNQLEFRSRGTGTNTNGTTALSGPNSFAGGMRHVVVTHTEAGVRTIYDSLVAGSFTVAATDSTAGAPSNWAANYPLVLGNELDGSSTTARHWLGKFYRVVVHEEALTQAQVLQNWGAGPTGTSTPAPPTVSWSEDPVSVGEWEGSRTIQLVASYAPAQSITVNVSMALSQASFSESASVTTAAFTILQGQTTVDVPIYLTDSSAGPGVTGSLTIETGTGYTPATDATSAWQILSDDSAPTALEWTTTAQTVGTAAGDVTVTLQSDAYYNTAITVDVAASGTATEGPDFTLSSTQVTLPAQTLTADFTVNVTGQANDDGDTIILTLSNPSVGTVSGQTEHTITLSSSIGQKPGPGNTGPNNPSALVDQGSTNYDATSNGQVFENITTTGRFRDNGFNVTVRNCRFLKPPGVSAGYTVRLDGASTIEDCEIYGGNDALYLSSGGATVSRCNIWGSYADGIKDFGGATGFTVQDCWIHQLGTGEQITPGADIHADGSQKRSGTGSCQYLRCNFDMPYPGSPSYVAAGYGANDYHSNACLIIQAKDGNIANLVIDSCWLNGGNFTVYLTAPTTHSNLNATLTNNIFGVENALHGSAPESRWLRIDSGVTATISGNTRADTGENIDALL